MKKISTLLMAAAALTFSASAVEPVEVPINNFSFEEGSYVAGNANVNVSGFEGWDIVGSAGINAETGEPSGFYAVQARNKTWTNGNWGNRTAVETTIDGANYISQKLSGVTPGIYVLQFDGMITRASYKSTLPEGMYGFAFIQDNYPSAEPTGLVPGVPTEKGDGITALWTNGQSDSNGWLVLYRYFVIHECSELTYEDEETDITFGFGYPNNVDAEGNPATITKARLVFDDFILRRFDTKDVEEVKSWVNNEIAKIEAGDYSVPAVPTGGTEPEPVPMNVTNPSGNINIALSGFVTNSGWEPSTGINDIAAPVVKNDKYYNLQGIEIAKPTQAGIYIHNGKKYIVR